MVYLKDAQGLKTFESHSCNDNKKTHKFKSYVNNLNSSFAVMLSNFYVNPIM